jgi:hypothetical protein
MQIERPERRVHDMLPAEAVPHVDVFICTYSGDLQFTLSGSSHCPRLTVHGGQCPSSRLAHPGLAQLSHPSTLPALSQNPGLQSPWILWSQRPLLP